MFQPIHTPRLLIRPFLESDLGPFVARRNDPEVARWQNWTVPFPEDKASDIIAEMMSMDGPANDEWWMAAVVERESNTVVGDLAINLTWDSRSAEVGYTLGRPWWGHGYAVEAVEAIVRFLFETIGVTRIAGMLHPENRASAMVLERTGFVFEGHTRLSYWVGDDNSDDWIYGMTQDDWHRWQTRPTASPQSVELVEVSEANASDVLALRTHRSQQSFVAPVLDSFADALVPEVINGHPLEPWMRAIVADEVLAGFVMVALVTEHHPEPYLWRLLIDRFHQRRGIGGRALTLVEQEMADRGWGSLLTSWVPGKGSPEAFYLDRGFVPTGEIVDGEVEGRKVLP